MKLRTSSIFLAILGVAACASPRPAESPEPAPEVAPGATPAEEPAKEGFDITGTWDAEFGGTQEFATVGFDAEGRFRGHMKFGPDDACCLAGTYVATDTGISFSVESNSCPTGSFTDYPKIWRQAADELVLANPEFEQHIVEEGDGSWSGPVWTLRRASEGTEVATCEAGE